jgi:hypothetical protein
MTVGELKKELEKYDDEMRLVNLHDDCQRDIRIVKKVNYEWTDYNTECLLID